ncbi:O-methyltransferase [Mucilaginibacter sp. L3T2-6]|uniref:O-methyltransferase n=1 Tax=Mucilaginibacter sp. L3T2-6 TaxID=3062491 RepID=UPI0026771001|nr:class I SAM-dependent methyltransferase [Mucilaginibacter sp. L3T2-6]MDO3643827.1 class I SAM-dependent methyltransferase [Mucilaginibacter sp. L3T2-6]MDV6216278.1 class I SAM-dependent methyltransferase [Mucilaginibacter sp. L3T2-6]
MLNFRFAKDYVLHRLNAKTRHGVHSPFVYRLIDEVIYDFNAKKVYAEVENIRKELLNDARIITVTDLGAGSHLNNNRKKKVSDIARNALKPPKLAQLLYRLAADWQPRNIIELGTCLGTTTLYLKKAAPLADVYTMEGCPETAKIAAETFHKGGISTEPIVGNFDDTLSDIIDTLPGLDFVFVDGNHQKEATLKYFEWCLPKVHENTMLIFDDIYWSEGMKEAWAEIKAHLQVTVTVDLFWIGLVFFRPGQVKEDFLVRY